MSILGVQTSVLRSGDQFFVFASSQAIALYIKNANAILRKHEHNCFFRFRKRLCFHALI